MVYICSDTVKCPILKIICIMSHLFSDYSKLHRVHEQASNPSQNFWELLKHVDINKMLLTIHHSCSCQHVTLPLSCS